MLKYYLEIDYNPLSTNYKKEETKVITSKGKKLSYQSQMGLEREWVKTT